MCLRSLCLTGFCWFPPCLWKFRIFAFVAPFFFGGAVVSEETKDGPKRKYDFVVIDPGHGGKDGGAKWYGVTEKNLTLDLAKRVKAALEAKGIEVALTRSTDEYVDLLERAEVANRRHPGSIFVSLHFNAHLNRSIKGIETFYYPGSADAQVLAGAIQSELGRRAGAVDRGVRAGGLKVLRKTKCPAVLVECGFLSNRWECQRCAASWFRQILAEEIARGIARFLP